MVILALSICVIVFVTFVLIGIVYYWCIKPGKNLLDGLDDWMEETSRE